MRETMDAQERTVRAYLRALRRLPGSGEKNEAYRGYIRDSIREVFASRPDAGEQEVRELIGDPEAVRDSYVRGLSPEERERGRIERGRIRARRLAVLLPLCLIALLGAGWAVRSYFFPVVDVAIARPVDPDTERYIERPMLIGTGSIFGKSAGRILQERIFVDNVSLMEQEIGRRYPGGFHITCTVTEGKGETIVSWTGTGTTGEGVTEEVEEQYVCPYRFRVGHEDLSGEAAARARYAEEAMRQAVQEMER